MEPVHLVCEGCGARLRTSHPEKARGRVCPRCSTPLSMAVDRAISDRQGSEPISTRPSARRLTTGTVAILVTIGSLASLAVRESSPGRSFCNQAQTVARPSTAPLLLTKIAEENEHRSSSPVSPVPDLARLEVRADDLRIFPGPAGDVRPNQLKLDLPAPLQPAPRADQQPPPQPPPAPGNEPRRVLVRDTRGRAIVAREHGMIDNRMAVLLPDGQIGWPDGLVVTDRPFVPISMEEMRRSLLDDPEFAAFRIHQTAHYLILYQSTTDKFALASADLLEKLHDGLTGVLKKHGLPVVSPEFPLVAVIFRSEDDFRAHRRVAPEVQACYEILSNRIYFYEKSKRDQEAPEVAALRKPQTVAHEGTHQLLHNVGIQPRLSDWPLWLVEGLAEYCSPPKTTKKGVDWAGLGQVNPIHMATLRDLEDPLAIQVKGGARDGLVGRDRRTSWVEDIVTRKELTPTDYALCWALTHYLANQRIEDFVAYLKGMSGLKPFEERTPQQQLDRFREVFGGNLAQMDDKIGKYVKKLKQSDALPYYAVFFEQPVGSGVRRQAMVSQSPSVIRQWLEASAAPEGGPTRWQALRHPTHARAVLAAEQWLMQGR